MEELRIPLDEIKASVQALASGKTPSPELESKHLKILEEYECWEPMLAYLKRKVSNSKTRNFNDYVKIALVQAQYLENIAGCAETCAQLVVDVRTGFQEFSQKVIDTIFEKENYVDEAVVLRAICDKLPHVSEQVLCLERLCLIYEKKYFNEDMLNATYEKLLQVAPKNAKALRYFKMVFTQNHEWDKVADILETLLENSSHSTDRARLGLELASVNLYQLDSPTSAIQLVEEHCKGGFLDTSTVLFEAYRRLGDLENCIKILQSVVPKAKNDRMKAILFFKIATLHKRLRQWNEAENNYATSIGLDGTFLEAFEGMIEILIAQKKWPLLEDRLGQVADQVQPLDLKKKIGECRQRVQQARFAAKS
ncbi:MAG: tetratricopeptide repeat protein [Oligoflexales bacterium]